MANATPHWEKASMFQATQEKKKTKQAVGY